MNSWEEHAQTWKMMPLSSSVLFFAGVFCLFAALILVGDSMDFQSQSAPELVAAILISGGFAIGWAYAGTRKIIWLFFAIGLTQFAAFLVLNWLSGAHRTLAGQELER